MVFIARTSHERIVHNAGQILTFVADALSTDRVHRSQHLNQARPGQARIRGQSGSIWTYSTTVQCLCKFEVTSMNTFWRYRRRRPLRMSAAVVLRMQ